jgi:hypothetical protein
MILRCSFLAAAVLLMPQPSAAQLVEEVRSNPQAPGLPEDLFRLPSGVWAFARQLWKGDEPCTADACEAGYTTGDLAVSVERHKTSLRIVAGFRGCANTAWNEYEVGKRASKSDTKTIAKRLKTTVGTSAKYCKVAAPPLAELDARRLYPDDPQSR